MNKVYRGNKTGYLNSTLVVYSNGNARRYILQRHSNTFKKYVAHFSGNVSDNWEFVGDMTDSEFQEHLDIVRLLV